MTDHVVYIVGAALLLTIAFIGLDALLTDDSIPDVLQNIAVGSLTGLVGLLAPSPVRGRRIAGEAGAIGHEPGGLLIVLGFIGIVVGALLDIGVLVTIGIIAAVIGLAILLWSLFVHHGH